MPFSFLKRMFSVLFLPFTWVRHKLNKLGEKFIASRSGPFDQPVTLDSSRVYILPTRIGIIYGLLLIFLLLGSINYTKSLGYMLTFLLVGLGLVAMLTTWRNLAGLQLSRGGVPPVFAGQNAKFSILLENYGQAERHSLQVEHQGRLAEITDVASDDMATVHFSHHADQRGYYNPKRFRLSTEFPLGLFVAWTWVDLSMKCLVYPKPSDKSPDYQASNEEFGEDIGSGVGMEDFAGLRKFQHGDSWRRINWKAAARSDELYSKEFHGSKPQLIWIDYFEQPAINLEQRLSDMTRMVVDAHTVGSSYGLRLPNIEVPPDNNNKHYHACLRALAEYSLDNNNDA